MGTNFYFKVRGKINVDVDCGIFTESIKSKISNILEESLDIHIGKRSGGWKPLLRANEYYDSFKSMKSFYNNNKEYLSIMDEYDREYTFDELVEDLIHWNKDNKDAKSHIDLDDYYENKCYVDEDGNEFIKDEFS